MVFKVLRYVEEQGLTANVLSQSVQAIPTEYAFAVEQGDELVQCHQWVKCRDFLLDILIWETDPRWVDGQRGPVYGLNKQGAIALDKVRLLSLGSKPRIDLLNKFEETHGYPLTTMVDTNIPDVYYIVSDALWLRDTVRFSWFTMMLRMLSSPGIKPKDTTESCFDWILEHSAEDQLLLCKLNNKPVTRKKLIPAMFTVLKDLPFLGLINYKMEKDYTYIDSSFHSYNGYKAALSYPMYTKYGDVLRDALLKLQ